MAQTSNGTRGWAAKGGCRRPPPLATQTRIRTERVKSARLSASAATQRHARQSALHDVVEGPSAEYAERRPPEPHDRRDHRRTDTEAVPARLGHKARE